MGARGPVASALRGLVAASGRPWVRRWVRAAYAEPSGAAHRRIQSAARAAHGLDLRGAVRTRASRWLIHRVAEVQREWHRAGRDDDLGPSPIGFEDLRVRCRTGDANSSEIFLFGFSDNLPWFELYRRFATAGTLALDVGANLGIHSLVLSRCVGSAGRVAAYEPNPSTHARLLANLALNDARNVSPVLAGLGASAGRSAFDAKAGEFNIGLARVDPAGALTIELRTVDQDVAAVGLPVSLIKIDVEGGELDVLRGARATLRRDAPSVVLEFNPRAYSLDAIRDAFPYPVSFHCVPTSAYDRLRPMEPADALRQVDLLVRPDGVVGTG